MAQDKSERARSWFCVLNNPQDYFEELKGKTPEEHCRFWRDKWKNEQGENCPIAVALCVSAAGLVHDHFVLENPNKVSFDRVRAFLGNKGHIEATRGTKKQAEDYINKNGAFQEKGEKILYLLTDGEIAGSQGKRNELDAIEDLLAQGKRPNEIFEELGLRSRRYESIIKGAFFDKKIKDTPRRRPVEVFWHVGASGSGKSEGFNKDPRPDDMLFFIAGEDVGKNGAFDLYQGEEVLWIDELKGGHIKYSRLLTITDGLKMPIQCRYKNGFQLWNEVNITSIFTVDEMYKNMVKDEDKRIDSIAQIKGRITKTIYHFVIDKSDCSIVQEPRERLNKDPQNLEWFEVCGTGFATRAELEQLAKAKVEELKKQRFPSLFDFMEEEKAEDFAQIFDF